MKHNRVISIISGAGLALLALMMFFTSPTEIGPVGVLVFFTTIYAVTFGLVCSCYRLFLRLALDRENFGRKDYLHAAVLAFAPIMLLMARSFGAVNLWTTALIVIFVALAEFLVARRT